MNGRRYINVGRKRHPKCIFRLILNCIVAYFEVLPHSEATPTFVTCKAWKQVFLALQVKTEKQHAKDWFASNHNKVRISVLPILISKRNGRVTCILGSVAKLCQVRCSSGTPAWTGWQLLWMWRLARPRLHLCRVGLRQWQQWPPSDSSSGHSAPGTCSAAV